MGCLTPADVYYIEEEKKAPDTNNLTIEGQKVPEGKVVKLENFYIKDETTANKTMRLGIKRGSVITWFKEAAAATNDHQIAQDGKTILVSGEIPVGMIESPTSADVCRLLARGVYL